jgi:hypothetical protein
MRFEGYTVFRSGSPNHPGNIVVPIHMSRISAITLEHRKLDTPVRVLRGPMRVCTVALGIGPAQRPVAVPALRQGPKRDPQAMPRTTFICGHDAVSPRTRAKPARAIMMKRSVCICATLIAAMSMSAVGADINAEPSCSMSLRSQTLPKPLHIGARNRSFAVRRQWTRPQSIVSGNAAT